MIINCPSTYEMKIVKIDTKKYYLLKYREGRKDEEQFVVKAVLEKYIDGECYGTQCHYGWVFVVVKILKKYYNRSKPDGIWHIGTLPDYCDSVVEYDLNDGDIKK